MTGKKKEKISRKSSCLTYFASTVKQPTSGHVCAEYKAEREDQKPNEHLTGIWSAPFWNISDILTGQSLNPTLQISVADFKNV